MTPELKQILSAFQLDTTPVSCERYGCGHINETYLVTTKATHRYILQKINGFVFRDIPALMQNIAAITAYLRDRDPNPRGVLQLIPTVSGSCYLLHSDGSYWRMYDFIEDSLCLQLPETSADFYESAVAFGGFQQQLMDFPAHKLNETIPNFHNTADRYRLFRI